MDSVLAVGVKDVRGVCDHGAAAEPLRSALWPLAAVVWSDLARALPVWMAIKETVIVVPRHHARRRYVRWSLARRTGNRAL